MIELILAIIMALISYFTAKKKGNASDTQAAAVAAAAGIGTYYVATETEWGQSAVDSLEGWLGLTTTTNPDGTGTVTSGTRTSTGTVVTGPNGESIVIPTGALSGVTGGTTLSTNGWDVLKSWGATGTAAVVGTTALATSSDLSKWIPWILIGGGIWLMVK